MVTLKEVAEAAGVAVSTASRALHREGRINATTAARVRRVADDLGYAVNHAGRALTTGRTGLVGVVVPHLTNPFFAAVVEGIQLQSEKHGSSVVLAEGRGEPRRERTVIRSLAEHVDGLVLVAPTGGADTLALPAHLPCVTVDHHLPGHSGVVIDTEHGIGELVAHLHGRGAGRIAYIGGPPASKRDADRRAAFVAAADAYDVAPLVFGPVEPSVHAGVLIADDIRTSEVAAVIAFSSHVALGLHFALGDGPAIQVTAADDLSIANTGSPLFTALSLPLVEAGRIAIELLMDPRERHESVPASIARRAD